MMVLGKFITFSNYNLKYIKEKFYLNNVTNTEKQRKRNVKTWQFRLLSLFWLRTEIQIRNLCSKQVDKHISPASFVLPPCGLQDLSSKAYLAVTYTVLFKFVCFFLKRRSKQMSYRLKALKMCMHCTNNSTAWNLSKIK